MGNYKARRPGFLEAWKIAVAHMMFEGKDDGEIAAITWPPDPDLPEDVRKRKIRDKKRTLQALRKDPKFMEYYNSLVTEWKVHSLGPALKALNNQVAQDKDLWLQNKAANDVLNHTKELHTSEEENTITVKFEGMPELGSPGDEEDDA